MPELPEAMLIAFLVGAAVGSFLNMAASRLPRMMEGEKINLFWPPSHCFSCGKRLAWHENIPILSYLWQKGRCQGCGAAIGARHLAVEVLAAALASGAVWRFGPTGMAFLAMAFSWTCLLLAAIDAETFLLPDILTWPLAALGLLVNFWQVWAPWRDALIGAVAGYGVFWAIERAFFVLRKKEGLGRGDAKLLAALGAWLGWMALPWVLLIASALGILFWTVLALAKAHDRETPVPFGPFLAAGGVALLFFGEMLLVRQG